VSHFDPPSVALVFCLVLFPRRMMQVVRISPVPDTTDRPTAFDPPARDVLKSALTHCPIIRHCRYFLGNTHKNYLIMLPGEETIVPESVRLATHPPLLSLTQLRPERAWSALNADRHTHSFAVFRA
jgi:hypothetical protein